MEFAYLRIVPIRSLRLPSSFLQTRREPRVLGLAESIRLEGLWCPIIIRRDGRVLDGKDRVAAALRLGWKKIPANVVDCTDVEADAIEKGVNVQRRHNPEEQQAVSIELIRAYEAEEREKDAVAKGVPRATKRGQGRQKSATTRAVERLALELGEKPGTIRKRVYRAQDAVKEARIETIKLLGMEVPESWRKTTLEARSLIDHAALHVQQALGTLTSIEKRELPFPEGRLQRLREMAAELAAMIRQARPVSLCPFCKDVEVLKGGCAACAGTGFICANQDTNIPPEFLREENPLVLVGGQPRSVWDYVPQNEMDEDPFGLGETGPQ